MENNKKENVQVKNEKIVTLYTRLFQTELTKEQKEYSYIPRTSERKVVSSLFWTLKKSFL